MHINIKNRLNDFGLKDALALRDKVFHYQDISKQVDACVSTMIDYGVAPGDVLAIEGATSLHTVSAVLAAFAHGLIVIPMTRLPQSKRTEMLQTAEVEWLLTVDQTNEVPRLTHLDRKANHPLYAQLRRDGEPL
ncbi:hypothetical protein BHUM_01874 [Candidatus Burkholderia humilis]|nr:hypothetical protein BHUM_01874 [Candidatus Burkholderia humilis]